jgi:hypothetical protein
MIEGPAMRKNTNALRDKAQQPDKRPTGPRPIDDVLAEFLARYSAQFPQLKIVIVSPMDNVTSVRCPA